MPAVASDIMTKGSALNIPSKTVRLTDMGQLPADYSQTPGGTMFATTPGGTRIIYDRSFLMKMRNSPVAATPPKNLPFIAGVTSSISPENLKNAKHSPPRRGSRASEIKRRFNKRNSLTPKNSESPTPKGEVVTENNEEPQFSMEM